ncbi:MAG: hypothetical protein HYU58_21700 [Proteobacteria bacterium]|nr:hypothetical protein [Pseudomonadota bacterium]
MRILTLKQPDARIDAIENEERRSNLFGAKWRAWQNFRLLATYGPIGAAFVFALIWVISYY